MTPNGSAYLLLEVGGELFGLDLALVEAVIPYRRPAPVPFQKPEALSGLLHRGRFTGVADLGRILGLPPIAEEGRAVIAIVERGGAYAGLAASASHGLLKVDEMGDEARVIGRWEGPHLLHSVRSGDRVVHLIDAEGLLEAFSSVIERAV